MQVIFCNDIKMYNVSLRIGGRMLGRITMDDLHIGCEARDKYEVLSMISSNFNFKRYVRKDCSRFFSDQEHQELNFVSNGVVYSHLPESAGDIIIRSGVEIFQFPDGVIWESDDGGKLKIIFIAIGAVFTEQIQYNNDVWKRSITLLSEDVITNTLSLTGNKKDFFDLLKYYLVPS